MCSGVCFAHPYVESVAKIVPDHKGVDGEEEQYGQAAEVVDVVFSHGGLLFSDFVFNVIGPLWYNTIQVPFCFVEDVFECKFKMGYIKS